MFKRARRFRYEVPDRLWRRILAANANDEQLASVALATAFLVAADNVATPVVPARRREPALFLPCDPPANASPAPQEPPQALLDALPGSYLVVEGCRDPEPDAFVDPWLNARD